MSLYYSQHTDYTSAALPDDVDHPLSDFWLIEADDAEEALDETARLDGDDSDPDDIADETTLVPVIPILEKLRELGWTIEPPIKA